MKKLIFFIVVIAVITVGVFVFFRYRNNVLAPRNEDQQANQVVIEDKEIIEATGDYNIAITYPYIEGQTGFNQKVEDLVQGELAEFKKNFIDSPTTPYDLKISYTEGQVDESIASVVLTVYNYTGGAHGNTHFVSVNYDLKNKKEITLADVFAGRPNYAKEISDYAMKELNKQMEEKEFEPDTNWLTTGAGPNPDNFSAFLLKKESITFYFAPYQVAAYAAGYFQVQMPR